MLEAFYRQLFRPDDTSPSVAVSALIAGVVVVVMTLNAGSALHIGSGGIGLLLMIFLLGGLLGLFWLTAALFALTSAFGGTQRLGAFVRAVVGGGWPLIFSGVVLAAQQWSSLLGAVLSLVLTLGVWTTLTQAVARSQSLTMAKAFICLLGAVALSVFALGGLVIWPIMLLLGL